ncbi:GNAT family N-acetyltransferase (plasmid) [Cupriavidus necator]|nr:GNAT family N-acetyltransferase [Cupriavidus necator]
MTNDASLLPGMFHIALMDGRMVACAGGKRHADVVVVCSVAVLREYRDRGIAKHLVLAVLILLCHKRSRLFGLRQHGHMASLPINRMLS